MGTIDGKEFVTRLNLLKNDVWVKGEKVKGAISEHSAFQGVVKSKAALYDMQTGEHKSVLTHTEQGITYGTSFMKPKTKEDLEKRRNATQLWARKSGGMMGRAPDYMNTAIMAFSSGASLIEKKHKKGSENLVQLYEKAKNLDLSFTHTYVSPQVNRGSFYYEDWEEEPIAAQAVKKTKDGLLFKGARLLATQGGLTDELLVFSTGVKGLDEKGAFAFSIPSNTEGLTFLCREPFSYHSSSFNYPLSSRFDELDAIVIFNNVLVPWENLFFYEDKQAAESLFLRSSYVSLILHQVVSRQVVKLEFTLGVAQSIVDTINISEYQHVQAKISEIVIALETMRGLLLTSEKEAQKDQFGIMAPSVHPLYVAVTLFSNTYPRLTEIVELLGASGLITLPTEADFDSEMGEKLNYYLQSFSKGGYERVKLFRLAWDMTLSAFGTRQTLYERFFFGDPIRLLSNMYRSYPRRNYQEFVENFLDQ
ncbi:4-hydroxyphenylacetate 3-monooxygenase, oxygenase component [Priestia filamentosa]|uniref:4-hydroxyphenylacetate 3-monooxygenase, oxygenase component n=1 Tax=Priestia filamentosa TaxID=1402861 RepID=A0A1X7EY04_9BACI|nr:4-hydroxyphenylacetate 3-monooxygenase, oxygenase component [Priestia filamentosa]AKO91447.1 4-hydroxyphenylacetate 3-monooxygenase, oxygenase component [Priestia filamentosa]MDT3761535.1 4-hydroxyphenylacetate 3-monooxygenase, oxygenase component [Priestia filamentosa]OXS67640.1 4-hydroxyphenylacetate 3-monooxygenase, oxygenase component [Priestia filamentosa]RJS65155.1 4-hydroxyphenylacetate 3-monooxygenase, oxygenase component [Priestia filamentosa]WRU96064.1 4-hydroxyphenylacetate 3-mon